MRNYLTWNEAEKLQSKLTEEKKYDLCLLFHLSLHTGIKISDLLSLRWTDVTNKEGLKLIESKSKKEKTVVFNKRTKKYIAHIHTLLSPISNNNFCFLSQKKVIYSIQRINQILKETATKCGIRNVKLSTNSLRVTFGREVYYRSNGKALDSLSNYFGHPSDLFTLSYLKIRTEEESEFSFSLD